MNLGYFVWTWCFYLVYIGSLNILVYSVWCNGGFCKWLMCELRISDVAIFCDVAWTSVSVSGNSNWSFGRKVSFADCVSWNGMAWSAWQTRVCDFF